MNKKIEINDYMSVDEALEVIRTSQEMTKEEREIIVYILEQNTRPSDWNDSGCEWSSS